MGQVLEHGGESQEGKCFHFIAKNNMVWRLQHCND